MLQGLVEHRHHPVQHLGQVETHVLALVLHPRAHRRGIGGLPGRGQGHAEARQVGGTLARRAAAVQVVHQGGDHDLFLLQQHPAHRLGRMGGEHRLDVDAFEPLQQLLGAHALRTQPVQRVVQALRLWLAAAGTLVVAAAADAVHPLGDVDHLEIGGKRTHQGFGIGRRQSVQQRRQGIDRTAVLAPGDGGGAHLLDLGQERRRHLFDQHFPDQRPQPAHVLAQGQVRGGEFQRAGVVHRCAGRPGRRKPELTVILCAAAKPAPARSTPRFVVPQQLVQLHLEPYRQAVGHDPVGQLARLQLGLAR